MNQDELTKLFFFLKRKVTIERNHIACRYPIFTFSIILKEKNRDITTTRQGRFKTIFEGGQRLKTIITLRSRLNSLKLIVLHSPYFYETKLYCYTNYIPLREMHSPLGYTFISLIMIDDSLHRALVSAF